MSYSLLVKNVDDSQVHGIWNKKPSVKELQYCIGGVWEEAEEQRIINELILNGHSSANDSSCTLYELSSV